MRDTHHRRDVPGLGGEQDLVGGHPVEGRMLGVHHHEVEAEAAEDLGGVDARGLDEGPEQGLAGEETAPEFAGGRSGGAGHQLK